MAISALTKPWIESMVVEIWIQLQNENKSQPG